MAIFGSARDISMIRKVNRELLHDVITQQCAVYKYALDKTKVNMYGEASEGRWFNGPVLLNALITVGDKSDGTSDLGVDFNWDMKFAFLRDDLVDASLVIEIGDVILYQESYFEVDLSFDTQYFAGKDPQYPYDTNPLNPGLGYFGYNVSVIVNAHNIPADRVNIIKQRL
jgi:hypothetical protein